MARLIHGEEWGLVAPLSSLSHNRKLSAKSKAQSRKHGISSSNPSSRLDDLRSRSSRVSHGSALRQDAVHDSLSRLQPDTCRGHSHQLEDAWAHPSHRSGEESASRLARDQRPALVSKGRRPPIAPSESNRHSRRRIESSPVAERPPPPVELRSLGSWSSVEEEQSIEDESIWLVPPPVPSPPRTPRAPRLRTPDLSPLSTDVEFCPCHGGAAEDQVNGVWHMAEKSKMDSQGTSAFPGVLEISVDLVQWMRR